MMSIWIYPRPFHPHSIDCVLRETKVFILLKNHIEDPDDFIFGDPIGDPIVTQPRFDFITPNSDDW